MRYTLLLVVIFFSFHISYAQFNSKVGYNLSFASNEGLTTLFDDYNDKRDWLDQKYSAIRFVHGLEIGAKMRFNNLSFEIGLISGGGEAEAIGINPDSGSREIARWKVSTFDYHLNITQHITNNLGFGLGLANQRLKMKNYNPVSDNFDEVSSEKNWATRIYLQLEVPSKRVSFAFRPYYQIPFSTYSLSQSAAALGADINPTLEYKVFGLSILFFNGPQEF